MIGGEFNGNKARKLEYFLKADLSGIKRIVSYGSSQSNAMYSLSVFARIKGLEFYYVVSNLNSNLAANPIGNLKFALQNGMKIFISEDRKAKARELADENSLFINEGVWQKEAEDGFISQAREIELWADEKHKTFDVFLPSGTGTSAAFLAKHTKFNVFTCPCVGDSKYLKSEILALDPHSKARILQPPRKYHYGDLKLELYEIWREALNETGVEFDLIYDPVGLLTMFANLDKFENEILMNTCV